MHQYDMFCALQLIALHISAQNSYLFPMMMGIAARGLFNAGECIRAAVYAAVAVQRLDSVTCQRCLKAVTMVQRLETYNNTCNIELDIA